MVALTFLTGYILDLIFGDPRSLPHPVRVIGKMIVRMESLLRREDKNLKIKGLFLLISVSGISFLTVYLALLLLSYLNIYLEYIVTSFIIFQILATKSLFTETNKVYKALIEDDLKLARKELSYLVTRDCEEMDEVEIVKSTIETISENIVDGITSPLFYILLGGAPLGMFYKAVNTLDSMVGYKNDKYRDFGYFSAKFDDLINFIPARATSLIIILSTMILRLDYAEAFRILKRDKKCHSSPNSGWAEAPVAGALGITLGGRVSYFNEVVNKPTMGDNIRDAKPYDIRLTHKIMFLTSIIFFLISLGVVSIWKK